MVESKKKISNIYIHSFRGVPNELTVDFTDKNGKAVSTIIYGDNGSGKSSIVDALEFNLQGRIERSTMINNPVRASANSFLLPKVLSMTISLKYFYTKFINPLPGKSVFSNQPPCGSGTGMFFKSFIRYHC